MRLSAAWLAIASFSDSACFEDGSSEAPSIGVAFWSALVQPVTNKQAAKPIALIFESIEPVVNGWLKFWDLLKIIHAHLYTYVLGRYLFGQLFNKDFTMKPISYHL